MFLILIVERIWTLRIIAVWWKMLIVNDEFHSVDNEMPALQVSVVQMMIDEKKPAGHKTIYKTVIRNFWESNRWNPVCNGQKAEES